MRALRFLVVSQYFWPETFRVNDLVSELVARGHEVTVLTGEPNYPEGKVFAEFSSDPERFANYAGAQILRVPLAPRGKGSVRLVVNYLCFVVSGLCLGPWKLRGRQFDVIFVFQTSPITAAIPALLLRWLKRAPVLMWVLDLWPETLAAVGVIKSPRLLGWAGRMVAFIYRRCDRILVQSRAFFPNVERFGGNPRAIRYFPGWAEPIFEGRLEDVEPAAETAGYRDSFNIMFAGNIGDAQDFPAILDAASRVGRRDVRWLIVGDGRAAEMVTSEIARRGLTDRVVLLGRHPIDRMPSFFRAADALLVTLKADPLFALTIPGKVQSYLAVGVPILAMIDGEGARVIQEAQAGLVCSAGDATALAAAADAMAATPVQERSAMGRRAQAYCKREFDRDTLIRSFEAWADEVCVQQRSGKPQE